MTGVMTLSRQLSESWNRTLLPPHAPWPHGGVSRKPSTYGRIWASTTLILALWRHSHSSF